MALRQNEVRGLSLSLSLALRLRIGENAFILESARSLDKSQDSSSSSSTSPLHTQRGRWKEISPATHACSLKFSFPFSKGKKIKWCLHFSTLKSFSMNNRSRFFYFSSSPWTPSNVPHRVRAWREKEKKKGRDLFWAPFRLRTPPPSSFFCCCCCCKIHTQKVRELKKALG